MYFINLALLGHFLLLSLNSSYQTLRLYWRLRQIKAEIPVLISDSLDQLEEDFGCPLNFQLPLTLSGAISLLIDNEILHFFNEINCRALFFDKSIQKTAVKHKF